VSPLEVVGWALLFDAVLLIVAPAVGLSIVIIRAAAHAKSNRPNSRTERS